ncbi:MAG: transporter substrate-binding domain-containing protein [Nitrospirae bacterium]|nr:transporter substrate-binding domain-containing protein [Nitrospirota bacterium]
MLFKWLAALSLILLAVFLLLYKKENSNAAVSLPSAEKQWLALHRDELYFAPDPFYAPFEFYDDKNGTTNGFAHDYIRLVEKKLGVQFIIVRAASFAQILSFAKQKQVAIVNAVTETPERSQYLLFTKPFIEVRNVILVRKSENKDVTLNELSGKKVSVVKGYAITEYLLKNYPALKLDIVATDLNAILNVAYKISDAAILDIATASYFTEKEGISNVRVAGDTKYPIRLAIGSRKDWPELNDILNKGLDSISSKERESIYRKWLSIETERFTHSKTFHASVSIIVFLLAMLAAIVLWNKHLKRQIVLRMKAEEEIRRFNIMLKQKVEEETNKRMVQEQMVIQQSKLAAMGEMIGAIAHQWKQPLNAIAAIATDMKDAYEYGEFDKKYLMDSVKNTMEQIKHMSNTIDDFRNFFKPSKEKVNFSINSAVKEVIYLIHSQLIKADIRISLECKYDAVRTPGEGEYAEICTCTPELIIYGYTNEFKQAVLNIFGNARDAIVKKRQQGAFDAEDCGEILVELSKTDHYVILEIQDNGGGIPEDVIDNIFQPYFTTKEAEGTGIGLHMAKVIIEQHMGGSIIASNGAKGAVFTIELSIPGVQVPFKDCLTL